MVSFLYTGLGKFVIGSLLKGQGDTKTLFNMFLINFIISISLSLITIPISYVLGLMISNLTSQLISTCYGLYQVQRLYDVNIELASSLKILSASFLSGLPVFIFTKLVFLSNPIYGLLFGGILYVTSFLFLIPILGVLNENDLENLETFTKELPFIHTINPHPSPVLSTMPLFCFGLISIIGIKKRIHLP